MLSEHIWGEEEEAVNATVQIDTRSVTGNFFISCVSADDGHLLSAHLTPFIQLEPEGKR